MLDDVRIPRVERNSDAVDPTFGLGYTAISKVEPQQVGVLLFWQGREIMGLGATIVLRIATADEVLASPPVAYGAPRDTGYQGDLSVGLPCPYQALDSLELLL